MGRQRTVVFVRIQQAGDLDGTKFPVTGQLIDFPDERGLFRNDFQFMQRPPVFAQCSGKNETVAVRRGAAHEPALPDQFFSRILDAHSRIGTAFLGVPVTEREHHLPHDIIVFRGDAAVFYGVDIDVAALQRHHIGADFPHPPSDSVVFIGGQNIVFVFLCVCQRFL